MSENKQNEKVLAKGNAKEVNFKNGGSLINFSLKLSQLVKISDWLNSEREKREHSASDYLNFTMSSRRDGADEYGNTHYVLVDLWLPEAKEGAVKSETVEAPTDEMPF